MKNPLFYLSEFCAFELFTLLCLTLCLKELLFKFSSKSYYISQCKQLCILTNGHKLLLFIVVAL